MGRKNEWLLENTGGYYVLTKPPTPPPTPRKKEKECNVHYTASLLMFFKLMVKEKIVKMKKTMVINSIEDPEMLLIQKK